MGKTHKQYSGNVVAFPRGGENLIRVIRGQRVMLDSDLAALYKVTTGNLNLAVRRNKGRFPKDFMFELSREEAESLILQNARSKTGRGGRRKPISVFTELGVAMLSSVLNSECAIRMNMAIMRTFVRIREMIATSKDFAARIEKLERGHDRTSSVIEVLIEDIDQLGRKVEHLKSPPSPYNRRRIGYVIDDD